MHKVIPVCRPQLPSFQHLQPYLETIDERRMYSNYGPMVTELCHKAAHHYGIPNECVESASNATVALYSCLKLLPQPGGEVWMPAWTFAATPNAALMAGFTPRFFDVDPVTWSLEPHQVLAYLSQADHQPAAIMPVAPFGAPLDYEGWRDFHHHTGIPVIIDAAAGFDTVVPSADESPFYCIVISLHATKILPAGEGALILTHSPNLAEHFRRITNFGFESSIRHSVVPGLNFKISEYHGAIGLASLSLYASNRQVYQHVFTTYRHHLPQGVTLQAGLGTDWVAPSCVVTLAQEADLDQLRHNLLEQGVQTRSWYEHGCHSMPAFQHCPHHTPTITEHLGRTTLGLPLFLDMTSDDIEYVCWALWASLSSLTPPSATNQITKIRA